MGKVVGIGYQDFEKLRRDDVFYIDKTDFIREWWENKDDVTLITRPRRFGKTLTIDMLEKFFSVKYAGRHGPEPAVQISVPALWKKGNPFTG